VKRLEFVRRVLGLGDRRWRRHVVGIVAIHHAIQGEVGLHQESTSRVLLGPGLEVASLGPEQSIGFDCGNEIG